MIPELHEKLVDRIGATVRLRKTSAHEWAGPCPKCGGKDRFRVNDERGWFCRQCCGDPASGGHWGDYADFTKFAFGWELRDTLKAMGLNRHITAQEMQALEQERARNEAQQRREEAITQSEVWACLTHEADYLKYHRIMNESVEALALWQDRGLSFDWPDMFMLGYCPSKIWKSGDEYFECASLTIPYLRAIYDEMNEVIVETRCIGLRHRLLMDNPPGGKYRPHMAGAGNHLYFTQPRQSRIDGGGLLIVEGEIKAMVVEANLWTGGIAGDSEPIFPELSVVGIPGKSYKPEWIQQFRQARRVWICLDPDARTEAMRLREQIGNIAHVILLPEKIDDLLNAGIIDQRELLDLFRN